VALLRCQPELDKLTLIDEEMVGIRVLRKALQAPLSQIARNSGLEGAVVVDAVAKEKGNYGYNAVTGRYGDLMKDGVIDPVKVVRCALQNAASVAGLMLTTEAMVADKPKKEAPPPMGGHPPHGMGDMGDMDY
jgi:chaperonin GroEL